LTGGYGSAYNLWDAAKHTKDDILAVCVDFDYYNSSIDPRYIGNNLVSKGDIFSCSQIVNWINRNVRKIDFIILDLDNYDPQYSGIPQLEIINYARTHEYERILFNDDIKDESEIQSLLRRVCSRLKGNYVGIDYPLRDKNLTNFQCSKELPQQLKELCVSNKMCDVSVALEQNGMTETEIIKKQINIAKKSFKEIDNKWVCAEDKDFGCIEFGKDLIFQYPQYIKLWKEKL
jgi:hypothetical protein